MTKNQKEKKQIREEQIIKTLDKYQKTQVTVQQYCQLASMVITLHPDLLYESYLQFTRSSDRNDKGNYKTLAGFLCHPNVKYPLNEKDQRQGEVMMDAGKKIMNTMSYSWDYYFHLIKDNKQINAKQQESKEIIKVDSLKNNLILAKKRLLDMLNEMSRNKYHWQNYTKQLLVSRNIQEKEINQQQTLMILLLDILESQSQKMKESNNDTLQQEKQGIIRVQQKKNVQKASESDQEKQKQNRKELTKIINVQDYFRSKLEDLQPKISVCDTITHYEEQQKFNSNAFKYYMQADCK